MDTICIYNLNNKFRYLRIYRAAFNASYGAKWGSKKSVQMLVDSGGWDTLFHADIAKALGIDISKCERVHLGGITGQTVGYAHPVTIQISKPKDTFEVQGVFVPGLGTTSILGQKDFFKRYNVRFEKNRSKFFIEKVPRLRF